MHAPNESTATLLNVQRLSDALSDSLHIDNHMHYCGIRSAAGAGALTTATEGNARMPQQQACHSVPVTDLKYIGKETTK